MSDHNNDRQPWTVGRRKYETLEGHEIISSDPHIGDLVHLEDSYQLPGKGGFSQSTTYHRITGIEFNSKQPVERKDVQMTLGDVPEQEVDMYIVTLEEISKDEYYRSTARKIRALTWNYYAGL